MWIVFEWPQLVPGEKSSPKLFGWRGLGSLARDIKYAWTMVSVTLTCTYPIWWKNSAVSHLGIFHLWTIVFGVIKISIARWHGPHFTSRFDILFICFTTYKTRIYVIIIWYHIKTIFVTWSVLNSPLDTLSYKYTITYLLWRMRRGPKTDNRRTLMTDDVTLVLTNLPSLQPQ